MNKYSDARRLAVKISSVEDRIRRAEFQKVQLDNKIEFCKREIKHLRQQLSDVEKS